jgi:hypothetical protein
MKKMLLTALLLAAASVPVFAAADALFDSGVDASALARLARDAAGKDASVVNAQSAASYDQECTTFQFGANDKPISGRVQLHSQEWREQCTPTGCQQVPGIIWSKNVQLTLQNRPALLPWEHDGFEVCLDGPSLSADSLETAYAYTLSANDAGDIVAAAGRRTPESPDPVGILASVSANLAMTFTDKWASYYSGENVVLKVELMKVSQRGPDSTVLDKQFAFPVSASYALDLSKDADLQADAQYYAQYSIQRVGSVSNASFTPALKTSKVVYAP